jgi:hypothetical protein
MYNGNLMLATANCNCLQPPLNLFVILAMMDMLQLVPVPTFCCSCLLCLLCFTCVACCVTLGVNRLLQPESHACKEARVLHCCHKHVLWLHVVCGHELVQLSQEHSSTSMITCSTPLGNSPRSCCIIQYMSGLHHTTWQQPQNALVQAKR